MILGKVVGDVVSTMKHPDYDGYKMLIVQLVDHQGQAARKSLLAVDSVQAGIGDIVLVIDEGGPGRAILTLRKIEQSGRSFVVLWMKLERNS